MYRFTEYHVYTIFATLERNVGKTTLRVGVRNLRQSIAMKPSIGNPGL